MSKMWLLWIICIHCICCTAMIDIRFWNKPVPPQNKKTTTKKVCLSVVAFIFTNNWKDALWVLSSEQKLLLTLDLQNNFQLFSWLNFFLQSLRLIYLFLSRMDCNDFFLLGHSCSWLEDGSCWLWWFSPWLWVQLYINIYIYSLVCQS